MHIADWERPLESCSVLHANHAFIDLFGAPDAAFIYPGVWPRLCLDRERLAAVLVKSKRARTEASFARPDGEVRRLVACGGVRGVWVCVGVTWGEDRCEGVCVCVCVCVG